MGDQPGDKTPKGALAFLRVIIVDNLGTNLIRA